jgi:DNA polymerase V
LDYNQRDRTKGAKKIGLDRQLDLNEHLIRHPEATFFVYAQGDSMIGAGIHNGDLLIVDRAEIPGHGKVVIAVVNGEFTVKRLAIHGQQVFLESGNPAYASIPIQEEAGLEVWGVVTNVIHKV